MYQSKLKSRRKALRYTQRELSERTGISIRMIQFYEQGVRDLGHASANTVVKLADVLECDVRDLI